MAKYKDDISKCTASEPLGQFQSHKSFQGRGSSNEGPRLLPREDK